MGGVAAQHKILFLFISSMLFGMLQQISSNKKIYACPHVGAPFLWGPMCGRTGRTCLNPLLGGGVLPQKRGRENEKGKESRMVEKL